MRASGAALLLLCFHVAVMQAEPPRLIRVFPLGGQAGSTVSIEILGERLSNVTSVEFDARDIIWKGITFSSPHRLVGTVEIAPSAALGLHSFQVQTLDGPTNSGLFAVGALPGQFEIEPNDKPETAAVIPSLPVDVYGRLDKAPDIDVFAFQVKAGQRLVFDLRSIESGSAVEARMIILDGRGKQVAFNDDRDDYNENPRIEHRFEQAGTYYVKLDQYRGPRGFNFGKLCAYILRIGSLPVVTSAEPRVLRRGSPGSIVLRGSGLHAVDDVFLTKARLAEYSRMTFPYTMPIDFRPDPASGALLKRISGAVNRRGADVMEADFRIPESAEPGLWRLWVAGPEGPVEAGAVEVTDWSVLTEHAAKSVALEPARVAIAGSLAAEGERDQYTIRVQAGRPLQLWTMAEQIGVSHLDSVLTLRDASGKKLAESDDVVAGQGTLLGNPDSRLFFTPQQDGVLRLEVRDRTARGGAGFEYVLKADAGRPGFQLFTTPENFTVASGQGADLKVHLVREAGFEGEVDVWVEGLPEGATATRGRFRADQLFEPNADGADMVIPELTLRIEAPARTVPGRYVIRVAGSPVAEENKPDRRVIEAHSTLMLGPLLDAWNFVRRPLPATSMTVVAPNAAEFSSANRALQVTQGGSVKAEFRMKGIPENASFRLLDLPKGVSYRIAGRDDKTLALLVEADPGAATGLYEISAEADLGERRVPSGTMTLTVRSVAP